MFGLKRKSQVENFVELLIGEYIVLEIVSNSVDASARTIQRTSNKPFACIFTLAACCGFCRVDEIGSIY